MRIRFLLLACASGLVLVLAACSQVATPAADMPSASAFLSRAATSSAGLGPQAFHPGENDNGYASPLFDLSTAPNGDILVADLPQGVMLNGDPASVLLPLPGITSIGPIGRTSVWATTTGFDPTQDSGQGIWRVDDDGARLVANLFAFEETDPDGAGVDSNPYDVATVNGNEALVVDAGGNSLMRVNNRGDVELVATFPDILASTANFKALVGCPDFVPPSPEIPPVCDFPPFLPAQAVPTSVAVGPDGDYFVGELIGFPGPTGQSRIWKISEGAAGVTCPSADCTEMRGDFTSVIDLVFGPDGQLYVVELEESAWLALELPIFFGIPVEPLGGKVKACDAAFNCSDLMSGLPIITSIAFDKAGDMWGTEFALVPELANVVNLTP